MSMRVPPHNEDAERSVLGAAMISHEAMMNAVEMLRPEDFYNRINNHGHTKDQHCNDQKRGRCRLTQNTGQTVHHVTDKQSAKCNNGCNYRFRGAQKKRLS